MWNKTFPSSFLAKISFPYLSCYSILCSQKMCCCFLEGCQDPFPCIWLTSTLCASFPNVPSLKVAHTGSSLHSQVPFHPSFTRYRLVPCSCWLIMQSLLSHLLHFQMLLWLWYSSSLAEDFCKYISANVSFKQFLLLEHISSVLDSSDIPSSCVSFWWLYVMMKCWE